MNQGRIALDENDLRVHSVVTVKVYGDEAVWIGDVTGEDPGSALVSLGFKNVTLVGELSHLLDRLTAAVQLLERVRSRPQDWDLLLTRRRRAEFEDPAPRPHPFLDRPSSRPGTD